MSSSSSSSYISGAEIEEVFDHFDTENTGVLTNIETIKQVRRVVRCNESK